MASRQVADEDLAELSESLEALGFEPPVFAELINRVRTYRSFRLKFGDDESCNDRLERLRLEASKAAENREAAKETLSKANSELAKAQMQHQGFSRSCSQATKNHYEFPELFSDECHFTAQGYDEMAQFLWSKLPQLVGK